MPAGRESLCCQEVLRIRSKAQTDNQNCITDHEGFPAVCLNRHVVEAAIYQYIEEEHYVDDHPTFE